MRQPTGKPVIIRKKSCWEAWDTKMGHLHFATIVQSIRLMTESRAKWELIHCYSGSMIHLLLFFSFSLSSPPTTTMFLLGRTHCQLWLPPIFLPHRPKFKLPSSIASQPLQNHPSTVHNTDLSNWVLRWIGGKSLTLLLVYPKLYELEWQIILSFLFSSFYLLANPFFTFNLVFQIEWIICGYSTTVSHTSNLI